MKKNNLDDLEENGKRGDWAFTDDNHIAIRYGEKPLVGTVVIPISTMPTNNEWQWDGNKEFPTLTPSILVEAVPGWNEGWHGWLRAGVLVNA